ncbi:MAG: FGGY family carbohydrate kinase [Anaerolineae bacterium]
MIERMSDPLLMGLDIGTTHCKAVVYTPEGKQIGMGRARTPTIVPAPGLAEYAPDELWRVIVGVIRDALSQTEAAGRDPRDIAGLAVASMGEAGVLLDEADEPCSVMMSWHDTRTLEENRWWMETFGGRRVFGITGLTPQPNFTMAKLLWIRRHHPESTACAVRWLHIADWVAYRLTGAAATDPSMASRSMGFDLRTRDWSPELFEAAEIPISLMPPIVPAGSVIGHVTPNAAALTGLAAGTAVAAGGHDHLCGAFGVGATHVGQVLNSMGTAEALLMVLPLPPLTDKMYASRVHLGAHTAPNVYYTIGGLPASGATLEWACNLITPDLPREQGYRRLNDLAEGVAPGSLGATFLAHLRGAGPPYSDPIARGAFIGLTVSTGPAEMARAVFEGMAYTWRTALDNIENTTGELVRDITVIGGGARNRVWVQVKADVAAQPLHVVEVEEGTAWGAAALAGVGVGVFRDAEDVTAHARFARRTVEPDPARSERYQRLYHEIYGPLYGLLKDVHHRLRHID